MPLDVILAPLAAFAAVMVCVILLWLVSIPLRDVSIVDVFWGPGFAVAAWVGFAIADGAPARKWLVTVLTTVWALRLGGYLLWRKWGEGEDPRYTKLIAHYGEERRHRTALERVFLLQGGSCASWHCQCWRRNCGERPRPSVPSPMPARLCG